jgi:hypothetical protein
MAELRFEVWRRDEALVTQLHGVNESCGFVYDNGQLERFRSALARNNGSTVPTIRELVLSYLEGVGYGTKSMITAFLNAYGEYGRFEADSVGEALSRLKAEGRVQECIVWRRKKLYVPCRGALKRKVIYYKTLAGEKWYIARGR